MQRFIVPLFLFLLCAVPAMADELDNFLTDLDHQAARDERTFAEDLGRHFGVQTRDVNDVLRQTGSASDAFMIFELGRMTGLSRDRVMRTYEERKGQGWGAMAKEMGIKPGSKEFHALKNGDFGYGKDKGGKHGKNDTDRQEKSRGGKGKGGKSDKGGPDDDNLLPEGKGHGKGGGKGKNK